MRPSCLYLISLHISWHLKKRYLKFGIKESRQNRESIISDKRIYTLPLRLTPNGILGQWMIAKYSVSGNKQPREGEIMAPKICIEDKAGLSSAAEATAAVSYWHLYESKYFKNEAPGETHEHG